MSKKPHMNYSQEDIERYFSGQMSAKEMHDMEAYALEDSFLSDAMEGYEKNLNPTTAAHLKEIKEKILLSSAAEIVPLNKSTKWWKYAVAASVLLCIAIGAIYLVSNDSLKENSVATNQAPPLNEQYIDTTEAIDKFVVAENTDTTIITKADAIAIQRSQPEQLKQGSDLFYQKKSHPVSVLAPAQPIYTEMDTAARDLNDVVIGYGTQQRSTTTGATVLVAQEESSVAESLQGKVSGVSAERQSQLQARVKDEHNNPLPNVSVMVKNSNTGALTNNNGEFSIKINHNDTLLLSGVGYEQKEIPATALGNDIVLQPGRYAADEVVVVGYGGKISDRKKRKNAFSKDAGRISIRGNTTTSKAGEPLFIIDGVVASKEKVDKLDKNAIESMNVLKDTEASAIYGSRAANGVIVITTKKSSARSAPAIGWQEYRAYLGRQLPVHTNRQLQKVTVMLDIDARGVPQNISVLGNISSEKKDSVIKAVQLGSKWQPASQKNISFEISVNP